MNVHTPKVKRPATYQDLLDAPPNMVAELIRGALHLQPRPASPHGFAASSLGDELVSPFQKGRGGPGGWWIIDEPELHLGGEVVVPDLAGWRLERMPVFQRAAYFDLAPNWACEVLSPSTRQIDLGPKRDLYGEHGVEWLWFVDPEARTLEVFERGDARWMLMATLTDDAEVRQPPFDAIAFSLAELWPAEDEGGAAEAP